MAAASAPFTCLLFITGVVGVCLALQVHQGDGCLATCSLPATYRPVCGTDYVTYTSSASLHCWKKCRDSNLRVAHLSSCVDWILGNS
nr:uncharacterized protein LOC123774495 [Procambarus clarkii]